MSGLRVLLYVPNVIGYIRMGIIAVDWLLVKDDRWFSALFFVSVLLDGVDGWAARHFKQVSAFGAWLDVTIDIGARAMLWSVVWPRFAGFISSIEWVGFLCNYREAGKDWKSPRDHPRWIRVILANGFKNFWGGILVLGTHFLPLGIFVSERDIVRQTLMMPLLCFLWFGKTICFMTEAYFIGYHIKKITA